MLVFWCLFYLVNTLISDKFKKFIMDAVSKSDQKYAIKRRDEIEVAPEFAKLFLESTTYSSNLAFIKSF